MQYSKIFSVVALLVAAAAAAPICPEVPSHPAGAPGAPSLPLPGMPTGPTHGANGVPGIPGHPQEGAGGVSSTGGVQQAAMACTSATYTQSSCCDIAAGTCNALVIGAICPELNNIATSNMCCIAQPSSQKNNEQTGLLNVFVPVDIPVSCIQLV